MRYEAMYIVQPALTEEELELTVNQLEEILRTRGVEDLVTERRGKRRLAYEIQNNKEGVYVQMNYTANGTINAELERAFKLNEQVIRHAIFCEEPR